MVMICDRNFTKGIVGLDLRWKFDVKLFTAKN